MSGVSRRGFLSAAAGALALATIPGCAGASGSSSGAGAASSAKGEDGLRATAQEPEASPKWVTNLKEAKDCECQAVFPW